MTEPSRVLITGLAGHVAGRLAAGLEQRDDVSVIVGVDVREPRHQLQRTTFVRADVRNPLVAQIIEDSAIDTVIHLSTTSRPAAAGGRARMKESNVIGAMQLLAACQQTPSVRRFVLKSSAAVYGSTHTDPVSFRERAVPKTAADHGFGKDCVEIEGYVRAFGRRRKDADVTILRFANLLGPRTDGAFLSLFSLPVVPTVLGFDPRLQFVHEEDVVEVLERAGTASHPGIFNVAGDGVLYLSQCIRIAGRAPAPVPLPLVSAVAAAVRRAGRADVAADQLRFLQYGRVLDTHRLRERLGDPLRYTTRQTFEDFVHHHRGAGLPGRQEFTDWQHQLAAMLRSWSPGPSSGADPERSA